MTVKRGDLAIIHTVSRVAVNGGESYDSQSYGLHVVTSITRDGAVKAIRELTSPDGAPVPVARLGRHTMATVPATVCDMVALAQHVRTVRASDTGTGYVPAYTTPVEVLRDLAAHVSDVSAIATVRAAARLTVREEIDFCRAHCARCGVRMADGAGMLADDSDGCPIAVCRTCPHGVDFATAYPPGLEVTVTRGYAQHITTRIDRVMDYVIDGYYAGRSYAVVLAGYGPRTLTEDSFAPVHVPADRYAVNRETSQPVEASADGADGAQPETSRELAQPATVAQPETSQPVADGGSSQPATVEAATGAAAPETSHTVPADGGDLAQPETSRETSQPATVIRKNGTPLVVSDVTDAAPDYDMEAAQRSYKLGERARKAVSSRQYSGKPGALWHLSDVDWPRYNGTYGKAAIYATDDGRAYSVHTYAYHDGSELAHVTVKTLDSAFTNGERMADTAPAPAAPAATAAPAAAPADGGAVDMPALTARLARFGFMLAPDGTVTDSGALVEERGGDSRGMLTHTDHAQLLTALGDRQGAAMMRAAGALEAPEVDEETKQPRPRTDAQRAQLRAAIPAGVRGAGIPAIGDGVPAVRGAGTVQVVTVSPVPAIGATVEVDGRRGRMLRTDTPGRYGATVAVFFPADGGASLPAPVEAQRVTVQRPVPAGERVTPRAAAPVAPAQPVAPTGNDEQPETAREVTCPLRTCGRVVKVTAGGAYAQHSRGRRGGPLCGMSGRTAPETAGAAAPETSQPVADGGRVTCPAPACGRNVRVTRTGCYGAHRSPNLCEMSGKPVGSPAPASRVVFAAQPAAPVVPVETSHAQPVEAPAAVAPVETSQPETSRETWQPVAPAGAAAPETSRPVAAGDRVRVGFTAGTVASIDGDRALVQLDTGGAPHRVPVAACKPDSDAPAQPVETSQPVAPVASLADIAAASDGRVILATVGADGIRPVEAQPAQPADGGETAQPDTADGAAAPVEAAPRLTRNEPHEYKADRRSRRDSRNRHRCECGATYDARRVHLTPRQLAEYRAQREREAAAGAPVVAPGVLLLEHTTDGGTVLRGTDKGDGSAAVMGRSGQGWGFSRNIGDGGAWYVPRSRGRVADWETLRKIDRAAVGLAAAGFRVAVVVNGEPREVDGVPVEAVTVEATAAQPVEAAPAPVGGDLAAVEAAADPAPAQPAADGGASAAQPVTTVDEPGVSYEAAWIPADGTVTVVRNVRAGICGPFGDYPADSREAAAAVLAADGYAVTGEWEVSRLGDHWAPLARLPRPVVDFPMPAPYYAPGYAPADGAQTSQPDAQPVAAAETSRELAPAQPETSQPAAAAEWLTPAQTATLVRAALREAFPAVTFSVRCSRGSAVRVHWQDGPTEREVRAVTDAYRGADFDGMQDMKTYRGAVTLPDGRRVRFGADFIFTSREETAPAPVEVDALPVPAPVVKAPAPVAAPPAPAQPVADSRDYPHAAILRDLAGRDLAGRVKVTARGGAWSYRAPLADGGEVCGRAVWADGTGWVVCEVLPTVPAPAAPAQPVAVPAVPDTAAAVVAGWAADRMPVPVSPAPAPVRAVAAVPSRVAAALARVTARPVPAQPVAVPAQPVAAPVAPQVAVPAPVVAPVPVPAGDRGRYAYAPGTRVRATLREVRQGIAAAARAPETAPMFAGVVCTVEADRPTVAQPVGAVVVSVEAPAGVDLAAVWAVVDGIAAQHVPAPVLAAV